MLRLDAVDGDRGMWTDSSGAGCCWLLISCRMTQPLLQLLCSPQVQQEQPLSASALWRCCYHQLKAPLSFSSPLPLHRRLLRFLVLRGFVQGPQWTRPCLQLGNLTSSWDCRRSPPAQALWYTTVQIPSTMLVQAANGFFKQHGSYHTFLTTLDFGELGTQQYSAGGTTKLG